MENENNNEVSRVTTENVVDETAKSQENIEKTAVKSEISDENTSTEQKYLDKNSQLNELETVDTNEENQTSEYEKPKSIMKIYLEDLAERLSFIRSLFYTGIVCAVSILGFIFFKILKSGFTDNISMKNSCLILQVFFGVVAVVFVVLFISSIVLNIRRKKHDKR